MNKNKVKQVFQTENSDCGLSCLTMVLNSFGCRIDLGELRKTHDTSLKGMTINQILKISNDYKVNGRVIKLDVKDINKVQTPAILHWQMTHYVVLNKVTKNFVYINDPELGLCKLTMSEFSEKFTGIAVEFNPSKNFVKFDNKSDFSFKTILSLIEGFNKKIIALVALTMLTQIFVLFIPHYSKIMVDKVAINYSVNLLYLVPFLFVIVLSLFHLINYWKNISLIKFSHSIGFELSYNIFLKLMALPVDFFEKRNTGDIISRFESVSDIKTVVSEDFVRAAINFATILIVVFVLLTYQILLLIPLLLSLTIIIFTMGILQPKHEALLQKAIIKEADASNEIIETVRGIQVVKLFGIENNRTNIWVNKFVHYMNNLFALNKHRYFQDSVKQYCYSVESIISLFLAVMLILQNQLTLGALFAFVLYKNLFTEASISLIELIFKFKATKIHVNRVADIINHDLNSSPKFSSTESAHNAENILEFNNVSYTYSGGNMPILNNVSFNIKQGETLVLTGPSGSGKTTIFKILAGILDDYGGNIYFKGVDIRNMNGASLTKVVGFVMQNDNLFTGSIASNVALFDADIDIERVKLVCEIANIASVIDRLPMGYYTMINDLGNILSSGQLQRLLIARALYHNPKILVLDEGTANLDPDNEKIILDNLSTLDITVIHAAHNLLVNEYADKVVNLYK